MESSYDTRTRSPVLLQPNLHFCTASPGVIANNGTRIVSAVEKFGLGLNQLRWGQTLPHYFNKCATVFFFFFLFYKWCVLNYIKLNFMGMGVVTWVFFIGATSASVLFA